MIGGLTAVAALSLATPASAQQAGIQVTLVDADSGVAASGVEVEIRNPDIGFVRRAQSDAQGVVRLEGLSTAGVYQVSTRPSGAYDTAAAAVHLRSNFTVSVTLSLRAATVEELVVTARRGVTGVNTVNAEVSASLKREELDRLPIEGRDVLGALVRLPNVVPSTGFFPEAPSISINGSNGLDTAYLIDGLDNNENFLGGLKFPVPLGFTRDVTVLANSYSAAYGRTVNGVVNYTSPSGGNELHGELYALVRPGRPFDARSPFPRRDLSGNPVGESFERYQAGGSLGGPIRRDRTFFYANLEYTRDRNVQVVDAPVLGAVGGVTGRNTFLLGSVRLDHRLDEAWTVGLRANHGRVEIARPGGGLGGGNVTLPSAGSQQDRISTLLAATASYAGLDWSYDGAAQFGRFRWNYGQPRGGAGPRVTVRDPSGLTVGVAGHPGFVFDELEQTWQTTHRLQRRLDRHRVRLGVDLIRSEFDLLGGGNPDGNYTVDLTPGQLGRIVAAGRGLSLGAADVLELDPVVADLAVELRPQAFGTAQTQLAIYLEDEWRLGSRFTATLGVRWDYDSLTSKGPGGGDFDNIAPRAALNYRPDARSAVRLGAGLFYGKIPYAVISDALQRNTRSAGFLAQLAELQVAGRIPRGVDLAALTFEGNLAASVACAQASACAPPADRVAARQTAILGEARILNPRGYDSPWSLQLSGGYQVEARGVVLSADLIYSRSHNLVRLRDLNAPAPFRPDLANLTPANIARLQGLADNGARLLLAQSLGLARSRPAADATRPAAVRPGGARQITVSETEGEAEYQALVLQANKTRGADAYAFRVAYTLSKLTNNTDDINFRAADANDFGSEWGPSANDRRHVISTVGYLYPAPGWTVSLAGLFQSGQPVNPVPDARIFGAQDLNGDGLSFGEDYVGNSDRHPGASRNAGRLPWSATIDIGVRYALPAAGGDLELSLDVFNLFNANNESGFANAATTSNQVQFGGGAPFVQRNAGPPRQVQVGAAWKF
jgi:outer membrane receptor protein involved in Fe transport